MGSLTARCHRCSGTLSLGIQPNRYGIEGSLEEQEGEYPTSVVRRYPLLAFYLLACAITWSVWVPQAAYWGGLLPFKVPAIFLAIGAFGPTLSAIILTAVNGGKASLRELLDRLLLWRVGAKWYILALFLVASIGLSAIALHLLLGGTVSEIATPFPWYLLLPAFLGHLVTASLGRRSAGGDMPCRDFKPKAVR